MPVDFPCPACAAPIPVSENDLKQPITCPNCRADVRVLLMVMPKADAVPAPAAPIHDAIMVDEPVEPLVLEPAVSPEESGVTCPNCGQQIGTDRKPGESIQCLRCLHTWEIPDHSEPDEPRQPREPEAPPRRFWAPLLFTSVFLAAIAGFVLGALRFLAMPQDQYQVAGYVCISGAIWTTLLTAIYFYRGAR
jgi:hypothetical protein